LLKCPIFGQNTTESWQLEGGRETLIWQKSRGDQGCYVTTRRTAYSLITPTRLLRNWLKLFATGVHTWVAFEPEGGRVAEEFVVMINLLCD
jgi:hypothetical protein